MKRCLVIVACVAAAAPLTALAAPAASAPAASAPVALEPDHVRAELVAETTALVPGKRNWVGLRLRHEPHWHTYWINPGDSGLATKLTWQVPAAVEAGAVAWPAPQRFEVGGLFNFGYSGDIVLPVPLQVAADAKIGTRVDLSVEAKWLVCREECMPGKATLKLSLPVATDAATDSRVRRLFTTAHAAQPVAGAWSGEARLTGDRVVVTLSGENLPDADSLDALIVQRQVVGYAAPQIHADDRRLILTFAKSEYLTETPVVLYLVVIEGHGPGIHARSVTVPFATSAVSAHPAHP